MQNKDRFLTLDYCKQLTTADKRGADPDIKRFERALVRKCKDAQIPMYCSSMLRSPGDQVELYVTGKSPDMPGHSGHEFGQACDIIHSEFGHDLPNLCWRIIGHLGEEIALSQGTNVLWGGILRPHHWEIL